MLPISSNVNSTIYELEVICFFHSTVWWYNSIESDVEEKRDPTWSKLGPCCVVASSESILNGLIRLCAGAAYRNHSFFPTWQSLWILEIYTLIATFAPISHCPILLPAFRFGQTRCGPHCSLVIIRPALVIKILQPIHFFNQTGHTWVRTSEN